MSASKSEYPQSRRSAAVVEVAKVQPKKMKKRKASQSVATSSEYKSRSDSESEYQQSRRSAAVAEVAKVQPKKKATKRFNASESNTTLSEYKSRKTCRSNLFGLEECDSVPPSKSSGDFASSLSRVDNGKVRRTADLTGDFYIERTSTASDDSESEGQHRERLGTFTSLPAPPKRWKQPLTEQNELEDKTFSSFSPHSVNVPLDQTPSFLPQSVNAPLEQPHSFLSQSVSAPSTVHTLTPTALYWSHKLDNLNRTQRLYAEKYINEILLEAELGNLGRNSVLINSSDQIETPKLSAVYSVCHPTPSSSDK